MMGFGPGMMGGGFSIILWIIIIGVVYYFFKEYNRHNHQNHNDRRNGGSRYKGQSNFEKHREKFNHKRELESSKNGDSAEQIARERYANGEITKEELNEIMDNLNNHNKNINP
jgi:putative membrane protein